MNDVLPGYSGLSLSNQTQPHENFELLSALTTPVAAKELCARYAYLREIQAAPAEELLQVPGMGPAMVRRLHAALRLANRLAKETVGERPILDSPERVADLLREDVRPYRTESFIVLLLDTRRRLVKLVHVATGTLDSVVVHPREVFNAAITVPGCHAIIVAHNHPSGDPTPSEADIRITRELIRAGKILKVELLDHVILGHCSVDRARDYVSLAEMGYFFDV